MIDYNTCLIIAATVIGLIVTCNLYEYEKLAAAKTTPFRFLRTPITYVVVGVLMFLGFPFLILYRLAIYLMLWIKHGRKFGGLLKGQDVIFSLEKECVCNLVSIVQYDTKANQQPFHEFARKEIRDAFATKFRKDPKSFATVEKDFGYYYRMKDAVTFDEICGDLKTVNTPTGKITKVDLMKLMNENINTPMIMDNKVPWEMLIGTQPIKWTEGTTNDFEHCYPIVMKVRHSTGDGLHLYQTFLSLFADDKVDHTSNSKSPRTDVKTKSKFNISCYNFFRKMIYYANLLYSIFALPSTLLLNMILLTKEENVLHGPRFINEKIIYFNAEETPHYINAIKGIKRNIRDCSFEDVILAALTASFGDYFRKHASSIPDYLTIEAPVVPEMVALRSLLDVESKNINCQNILSIHIRKLPLSISRDGARGDLLKSIEFIKRERRLLARSVEKEGLAWAMHVIMQILPVPFIQYSFDNAPSAEATISNMPGPAPFTVAGGYPLKDMVPFAGHRTKTGITITISSYNNRLKFGIFVDKALIKEEEEVQSIVDGFYKYIDLLAGETKTP